VAWTEAHLHTKWHLDASSCLAVIEMGRKLGALSPFWSDSIGQTVLGDSCKTVRPMLSDRCPVCPSVLAVTLVYCGQTVGWIKMKLGTKVGLGPGHIAHVRWRSCSSSPKGAQPAPIFGPYLLWSSGWMDQEKEHAVAYPTTLFKASFQPVCDQLRTR